jgi:hypothetical protein
VHNNQVCSPQAEGLFETFQGGRFVDSAIDLRTNWWLGRPIRKSVNHLNRGVSLAALLPAMVAVAAHADQMDELREEEIQ